MILQNWWYTTLLDVLEPMQPPLKDHVQADIVVVGGGMAGLSTALRCTKSGRRIVLLERNICGGSSTGKSAGFLTPDSELDLSQLIRRFGALGARDLWDVPVRGIKLITETVKRYEIKCDLLKQDSLFLGKGASGRKTAQEEVSAREQLGLRQTFYPADKLTKVIGSEGYSGAVRYADTHGINALRYAQGIKHVLLDHGVRIFESSEVRGIKDHTVYTHLGSVTASEIIICADKPQLSLTKFSDHVYHAQTFLAVSEPLKDQEVQQLFPDEPLQCWDSDLVYTYFRLTGDQRLLVGGGSLLSTFSLHYVTSPRVITRVIHSFQEKFPFLKDLEFIQYWPGFIDSTRDLLPTVLQDEHSPWIHYILGCVGLPWAAFCGDFVARRITEPANYDDHHYYRYFTVNRPFLFPLWMERFLGKPLVFTMNNAWAMYCQVDQGWNILDKPGSL